MSDEQDTFDEVFESMIECEKSIDDVIEKLAPLGVRVPPEKRGVVARWLDVFDQRLPLSFRLAALKGWLRYGR